VGPLRASPQTVTQLQQAKDFMAGVTLKNSHVAPSKVPSSVDLNIGGFSSAGQAALINCQTNSETHFVIWSSNDGKRPNPGIADKWPYHSTVTKVFGPFTNPKKVGDVPAGTNIYIFGYK
jgi:hypothetical protein